MGEDCEAVYWGEIEVSKIRNMSNSLGLYYYLASNRHLHAASTLWAEDLIAANESLGTKSGLTAISNTSIGISDNRTCEWLIHCVCLVRFEFIHSSLSHNDVRLLLTVDGIQTCCAKPML